MTDAERFTRIYDAHHRQVYAYAVTRAGRAHADDVAGDTFLVAWRRLHEIPATPLPWLLGVARNVARERYRDEARQAAIAAELRAWVRETEDDVAEHVTDRAVVLAALGGLSEDDREVLTLTAWHGLSARDAARVVGCSTATFFVRLHRARKRLRQAMTATRQSRPTQTKEYSR
ncbi:sigma-70 family RNA polymerase sigma factor [Dactylosporangium aurantiacum]|uniref:Sigma-70 family RNA polymerase sigma factor n=1 Tax=Dactylosporangium aurantiacum TaxID=35754 RepID=A0A9Q9MFU9_9ACTN|nr:sigma-70 family RNA polymerase sigma factor [Dactylosporangium aurantiacum]MDG6103081.1 sigma-70 family RNA polymerase sigma factor [Dactylosporangium aurantiacum]UWZ57593.1 sigma-70 family RNA polymerase sigma factor [Dactylosporangium aurantiacum]